MAIAALLATASSVNATLHASDGLTAMLAVTNVSKAPVIPLTVWFGKSWRMLSKPALPGTSMRTPGTMKMVSAVILPGRFGAGGSAP
jgi:hypothetical protein